LCAAQNDACDPSISALRRQASSRRKTGTPMQVLLDHCRDHPVVEFEPGDVFIASGERTGSLFILAEGAVEVFSGDVEIAIHDEPGSVFGEMSALLDMPHTASVRTLVKSRIHVVDNAPEFMKTNPGMTWPIAVLLARRLKNATDYLVNIKQQYSDREDHLSMVGDVLETLTHDQGDGFLPPSALPDEPSR
jgi:CRP-like cAMP-binding protein